MTVDDDPGAPRAVERDWRRQYGNRYRIVAADSGASALSPVEQIKLRNDPPSHCVLFLKLLLTTGAAAHPTKLTS